MLLKEYERIARKNNINYSMELVLLTNKKMQHFSEKHGYNRGNKFYFYEKKLK